MNAGIELDALVSEKVFGKKWELETLDIRDPGDHWLCVGYTGKSPQRLNDRLPKYSTDMGAVWDAVTKVVHDGYMFDFVYHTGALSSPDPADAPRNISLCLLESVANGR
jgi:hypothetical protein